MLLRITAPRSALQALTAPFRWAYDAIAGTNKRQQPNGVLRSEDAELTQFQRARLVSAGRDLSRNFTLLGWAVRKHLDYVSTFGFQAKGPRAEANAKITAFVAKWSKAENFDVAGRHSLDRFIRLTEQSRLIDGDVLLSMLTTGQVQAIEGDRIRNPAGQQADLTAQTRYLHGVEINKYGRALRYAIHSRGSFGQLATASTTFVFEEWLPAQYSIHHAYWTRFDQVRGVSPLAGAYNALRDLYEAYDYALAKMKVSQLLGLIIYSEAKESVGEVEDNTVTDQDGNAVPRYAVSFGKAPFKLELDGADRAEFLESKSPSQEFQTFCQTMVSLVLKAIDLPYSFYAENFSNYSGSRQALLQYEQSADQRRKENQDVLNRLTAWRLKLAIEAGDPDLAGVTVDDLVWEWVASSLPWIDPMKEVAANSAAVDRGFTSTPRVCKEQGLDAFEVAKEQADYEVRVKNYRESLGLPGVPVSNPVTYTELVNNDNSNSTAA